MVGVIGMVAASFLPESYKQHFPECVDDLATIYQYPYFSWFVWRRRGEKEDGGGTSAANGSKAKYDKVKTEEC